MYDFPTSYLVLFQVFFFFLPKLFLLNLLKENTKSICVLIQTNSGESHLFKFTSDHTLLLVVVFKYYCSFLKEPFYYLFMHKLKSS